MMESKRIMVVDDDAAIRQLFIYAFSSKGHTVCAFETAEEALEILNRETFPLMFFDLKLPGMSGVDLCQKVRQHHPESRIYAITAYASIFEISECLEAGFNDYFTKPFDIMMLLTLADET